MASLSSLTADENVAVRCSARASPPRSRVRRAAESLLAVGLDEQRRPPASRSSPAASSSGSRSRVTLAVAWPRCCWLDEPTSELDAGNRQRVLAALRTAADAGGAVVVLATHDPEAAEPADAELRLDDGAATWVRALER